MDDFVEFLAIVVLPVLVILAVILPIIAWGDYASCNSRWAKSGYETSWGPLQGCLIKVDNKWIPDKMLRRFENEQ